MKYLLVPAILFTVLFMACGQSEQEKADTGSDNNYGKGDRTPVRVESGDIETWITLISAQDVNVHLSAIEQLEDGQLMTMGVFRPNNPPKESAYLAKLDSDGEELWNKKISKSSAFWAVDGAAADDGGYLILGQVSPWKGDEETIRNVVVIKTDSVGQLLWEKKITEENDEEISAALVRTSDGNYVISGQVTSVDKGSLSTFLAKISPQGDIIWKKIYSDLGARMGIGLVPDDEGGCTATSLVTSTEPYANTDGLVFKVDANGEVLWSSKLGGDDEDEIYGLAPTSDGGFLIAGKTRSIGAGDFDMWIAKLNAKAEMEWQNAFGTERDEAALSAAQTKDGNYILVGTSRWYADGQLHMIGTKVDQQGNWMWEKVYKPGNLEQSRMVLPTDDGGAILAGSSRQERSAFLRMMVIKIDQNGDYKSPEPQQP